MDAHWTGANCAVVAKPQQHVVERTAQEWFAQAVHWYLEGHQACPVCQQRHCVFRSTWGTRTEFYCNECDFSVCQDQVRGVALVWLGETRSPGIQLELLEEGKRKVGR